MEVNSLFTQLNSQVKSQIEDDYRPKKRYGNSDTNGNTDDCR